MTAGDGGLEGVGAGARPVQGFDSAPDQHPVPFGPVLVGEQHRLAVRAGAGGDAGGLELQQRRQPVHLGFLGHQARQDPGQAQRVLAQGGADEIVAGRRRVALVEDEVDDLQDGGEALIAVGAVRDLERHPRFRQCPLRPDDPLGDRRFGAEVGPGDLLGGQAAHQAQGERDPGVRGEDGVAGGEDQPQQVVVDGLGVRELGLVLGRRDVLQGAPDLRELAGVGLLAADEVDGPVFGGGHQPGPRPVGHTRIRPLFQGRDERVLGDLLRDADVAHDPGNARDDPRGFDPEHRFDRSGRTHCRHGHPSEQP